MRKTGQVTPKAKSVILFEANERHLVVGAFRAGAKGVFCISEAGFKSLCRCVEQVHAGQIWGNCAELSEVIREFSELAPIRVLNADGMRLLTKREEEVVRLVAEGLQNREIAKELKLSEHTIKNYLFHIFEKLGVSSRVELVLYAVSSAKSAEIAAVKSDKQ
jgi:DNA-binding NarL/FixJ family response regulator